MTATDTFGKVTPDNRPRNRRRDPDEDPAAAPAAAAVQPPEANRPTPTQPGPNDPLPQPPGPAEPTGPTRATPGTVAARDNTGGGGTLASVLTAPNTGTGRAPVSDGVAALMNLAAMADRPVDPMSDWVGDGTRTPKFLAESVRLYARLTGRPTQEVMRDCLLGTDRIPGDVLDASWMRMYGTRREDYDPQDYR